MTNFLNFSIFALMSFVMANGKKTKSFSGYFFLEKHIKVMCDRWHSNCMLFYLEGT